MGGGRPKKLKQQDGDGSVNLGGIFKPLSEEEGRRQRLALFRGMAGGAGGRSEDSDIPADSEFESDDDDDARGKRGNSKARKRVIAEEAEDEEGTNDGETVSPPPGVVPGLPYPVLIPSRLTQKQRKDRGVAQTIEEAAAADTIDLAIDSERARERKLQSRKLEFKFVSQTQRPEKYGSIQEVDLRKSECEVDGCNLFDTGRDAHSHYVLKCKACSGQIVNAKKTEFKKHINGKGHLNAVKTMHKEAQEEANMSGLMVKYFKANPSLRGIGVDDRVHQFRLETVAAAMDAGMPLATLDKMRYYLEKWAKCKLTSSSHLGMYIKVLQEHEMEDIITLIKTCTCCWVIFDGTTRVDEVLCVVFRFVMPDFTIVQKLASLAKYKDCKSHEKLATAVLSVLSNYGVPYMDGVVGWSADRAEVNTAALDYLTKSYGGLRIGCISHTLTHVGEHAETTELVPWANDAIAMFSQSGGNNKPVHIFAEVYGKEWRHPGNTRWWAKFEVYILLNESWDQFTGIYLVQLGEHYFPEQGAAPVVPALPAPPQQAEETVEAHKRFQRVTKLLKDKDKSAKLRMELAAVAIVFERFITSTYLLEGDGPCALIAYDLIKRAHDELTGFASGDVGKWPAQERAALEQVRDTTVVIARNAAQAQQLMTTTVKNVAAPALTYFHKTIFGLTNQAPAALDLNIKLYKMARAMSPLSTKLLQPAWEDVYALMELTKSHLYFTPVERQGMQLEWSQYLGLTADLGAEEDDGSPNEKMRRAVLFWRTAAGTLPNLAKLARYCMLLACSSAAAERVFSVLKNSQSLVQMHHALEDYTEILCQRQYNHN